ncbi:MAG: hypothetical protein AB1938_01850 [Myxococcota bacterium]
MHALALTLLLTLGADEQELLSGPPKRFQATHPVPAWAPRTVSLGLTSREGMWSFQARLGWEAAFYERNGHDLVLTVHLGTGLALATPTGMTAHYQHVALAGFGYRKVSKLLNWGFHWGLGIDWYRAAYDVAPLESRVVAYTEGKGQIGLRVLQNLVVGAWFGYGSPVTFDARYPGQTYCGGLMFGLYADWR